MYCYKIKKTMHTNVPNLWRAINNLRHRPYDHTRSLIQFKETVEKLCTVKEDIVRTVVKLV